MITLLPLLSLLAACASNSAYDQGQAMLGAGHTEQGLALLEQAAQAEPTNAKYRIAATNGKMRALNNLNGRADALRQQGLLAGGFETEYGDEETESATEADAAKQEVNDA